MYQTPLAFKNQKHCRTCYCSDPQTEYELNTQRKPILYERRPINRSPEVIYSRIVPPNDPVARQVGENVIRNRIVWFKASSSRPSRITLRVSTPDKPNLRPSLYYQSRQKRNLSQKPTLLRKISVSNLNQPQIIPMTPIKQIAHRPSTDKFDQSTILTIPSTQKKYLDTSKASFGMSQIY